MKLFPLSFFPEKSSINFMKNKLITLYFSLFICLMSIFFITTKSMNFGIDFTGGLLLEVRLEENVTIDDLKKLVEIELQKFIGDGETKEISIQNFKANDEDSIFQDFLIKIGDFGSAKMLEEGEEDLPYQAFYESLKKGMQEEFVNVKFRKFDYVGPQVGAQLIFDSLIAVLLAFAAIMAYVAFRFKWQFSVGIILALIHDVIATMGILSFFEIDFNLVTIAGILMIIGYSVNNSVVIFDRIRENLRKFRKSSFDEIINLSLNETLTRTILTYVTTILAVLALLFVGGEGLFAFSLTIFLGISIGTYTSIFISSPILTIMSDKKK